MLTSTYLQTATYLLGVCLASISFVVFISSTSTFLIRDLQNIQHGVGDLVGTLGFVDELVALVACPVWGILSDRIGVRAVCFLGFTIIGVSLFVTVQAKNVYPQLLLARMFFALGGAAVTTMVTAILPSMVAPALNSGSQSSPSPPHAVLPQLEVSHSTPPSVSSELTITPARMATNPRIRPRASMSDEPDTNSTAPPRLAGIVGLFTGCGALVALTLFLPLPTRFSQLRGLTPAQALADSYYVVGTIAFVIAIFCLYGLRNLRGEEHKGWQAVRGTSYIKTSHHLSITDTKARPTPYIKLLSTSLRLGYKNPDIALAYLGGFVARSSSVGISLFLPLFVSAYFHSSGLCSGSPSTGPDEKASCRRAYILAAELTGSSQLVALFFALPLGYLSSTIRKSRSSSSARIHSHNIPLLAGALIGVLGYTILPHLHNPEIAPSHGGSPIILLVVALLGISQISAIVCSLGLLGTSVLSTTITPSRSSPIRSTLEHLDGTAEEDSPLISTSHDDSEPRTEMLHLKGSLAGTYSLAGGAGILLLTKLGGWMFDRVSVGSPFYLLAAFNGILLLTGTIINLTRASYRQTALTDHYET